MPALTIKNIPVDLYNELKLVASKHHRSINSEVIVQLKHTLFPKKVLSDDLLYNMQQLRSSIPDNIISAEDIDKAIEKGRL